MSLKKEDMRPGMVVMMQDFVSGGPPTCDVFEVTIIGLDPRNGKWVGASDDWALELSHIDDEDLEYMELKQ